VSTASPAGQRMSMRTLPPAILAVLQKGFQALGHSSAR
jgi:hypothetical protein